MTGASKRICRRAGKIPAMILRGHACAVPDWRWSIGRHLITCAVARRMLKKQGRLRPSALRRRPSGGDRGFLGWREHVLIYLKSFYHTSILTLRHRDLVKFNDDRGAWPAFLRGAFEDALVLIELLDRLACKLLTDTYRVLRCRLEERFHRFHSVRVLLIDPISVHKAVVFEPRDQRDLDALFF